MNTLEDMAAQAQRHLDGSRVNTDRMAKNVLVLVEQVRALEDRLYALTSTAETIAEPKNYSSAREAIDDMLRGAGLG
jgi:hypothetical protein